MPIVIFKGLFMKQPEVVTTLLGFGKIMVVRNCERVLSQSYCMRLSINASCMILSVHHNHENTFI